MSTLTFASPTHATRHGIGAADELTPKAIGAARSNTVIVAAANSTSLARRAADYVCTGTNDDVTIQSAINALGTSGGRVVNLAGTYVPSGPIVLDQSNVHLVGEGWGTLYQWASGSSTCAGIMIGFQPVTTTVTVTTTPTSIVVASAATLASSGTVYAYATAGGSAVAVTYTGKTGNTLTGCVVASGSLTLTAGVSAVGTGLRSGMRLEHMMLDGNYANVTGSGPGVWSSGTESQFFNVYEKSFRGDGWYHQPFDDNLAGNHIFDLLMVGCYGQANGGHQINYGTGADNSEFIRTIAYGANSRSGTSPTRGVNGFHLQGGGLKLVASHPYFNIGDGINVRDTASAITITDGEYESNDGWGINIQGGVRVFGANPRFYGNTSGDIQVASSAQDVRFIGTGHYLPQSTTGKMILINGGSNKWMFLGQQFNCSGGSSIVRCISVEGGATNGEIGSLQAHAMPTQDGNRYEVGISSCSRVTVHHCNLSRGIIESGTSDNNLIEANMSDGSDSTNYQIIRVGSNTRLHNNVGWKATATGKATLSAGVDTLAVTHGLCGTFGVIPDTVMLTSKGDISPRLRMNWSLITTTLNNGGTLTLPASTITVASTTGFPTSGTLVVTSSAGTQNIKYTGTTGTTFTGCTGGTGTVTDGSTITCGTQFNINLAGGSVTTTPVEVDYTANAYPL